MKATQFINLTKHKIVLCGDINDLNSIHEGVFIAPSKSFEVSVGHTAKRIIANIGGAKFGLIETTVVGIPESKAGVIIIVDGPMADNILRDETYRERNDIFTPLPENSAEVKGVIACSGLMKV